MSSEEKGAPLVLSEQLQSIFLLHVYLYVKGIARSDESTENYQTRPFLAEHFSIL